MIAAAATTTTSGDGTAVFIIGAALCIYFFPSIIAILRRVHIARTIVINLFLGWTFIGWVSALISACASKIVVYPQVVNYYQAPAPVDHRVPPGWYNNPRGPGQLYWDGVQWTD